MLDFSKKRKKDRPSSKPKRQRGRPKKPFSAASKRTQKERIKKFSENVERFLGTQTALELTDIFAGHFLLNSKDLMRLLETAVQQKRISKESILSLVEDVRQEPDLELLLFMKDLHALSDNKLWTICRAAGRSFSLGKLVALRKTSNEEAEKFFEITFDPSKGVVECSAQKALLALLHIEKKTTGAVPKQLQVKICADGRPLKKGQFVISLTALNLKTFSHQSREAVFQLLLAQTKERKEDVQILCERPYLQLQHIQQNGLRFEGEEIRVKVFFVPGIDSLLKITLQIGKAFPWLLIWAMIFVITVFFQEKNEGD